MITSIIIDDDKNTVNLFSEFLEIKGIKILGTGRNGQEAVQLYQRFKPDVVFLDVMMPKYDGFYALEEIRKLDPNAKVIMVTADLASNTADRLERLNASLIIYKPYEFDDVMDVIQKLFAKTKLEIL